MYEEIKVKIIDAFKTIIDKGLSYGRHGNISVRTPDDLVLITASGVDKRSLKPDDIIVVDLNGNVVEGTKRPSIELPIHLEIYRNRADVNAIIHAHPVYSTVFAVMKKPIEPILEESPLCRGRIEVADYAPAGSQELANNVLRALKLNNAVLMEKHGVIVVGSTLEEALEVLTYVERMAKIYLYVELLKKIERE